MAMPVSDVIRPLRRAEYDQLVAHGAFQDERIELLEGQLVAMTPIGAPHSSVIQELTALLVPALQGRAKVRIQSPFAALDTSEPEPDVAIVPLGDYYAEHPTQAYLLIEVAESSLGRDRGLKQRIYARAGVPEYWIVNIPERCIEVFREPSPDSYAVFERIPHTASVSMLQFADVSVAVAQLVR